MDLGKPQKRRVIERVEPAKQPRPAEPAEKPASDEADR